MGHLAVITGTKVEGARVPVSPGLQDLGDRVSFLGVEVPKGHGGPLTPPEARFVKDVLTSWDLKLMQKIAVGLELSQPVLIEGGSGIGKSTAVDRMCCYLNRESYYANCANYDVDALIGSKTIGQDGSVQWRDGIVIQCIRNGGVLFLDEYNFMRGEVRGRLHEVLDSVARHGRVSLTENYGEVVTVHPDVRIVAAQNPPGGAFRDREVLDPAQYARFMVIKEVDELPRDVRRARLLGAIGKDNIVTIPPEEHLSTPQYSTLLAKIPGIEDLLLRYEEFAHSIEQLLRERQIGSKQPQPVFVDFARDKKRVLGFVQRFYDGDPNQTFQQALRLFYREKFSDPTDRSAVEECINLVATDLSKVPTQRRGLSSSNPVTSTTPTASSLEAVEKFMGKNFFGPKQWRSAFGVNVGEAPPLPASLTRELLESPCKIEPGKQVKDTHSLVLVPATVNGEPYTPITLDQMCERTRGVKTIRWSKPRDEFSCASESLPTSRWVLLPKRDPDHNVVPEELHFRSKILSEQRQVHAKFYPEYRQAKTLELMTQVALHRLLHDEQLLPDFYLRCAESSAMASHVCVGSETGSDYIVTVKHASDDNFFAWLGFALARDLGG